MNYRFIKRFVIITFLFTLSATSSAASDRWFEVELLLFKRNVAIDDVSEKLISENVKLNKRARIEILNQPTTYDLKPNSLEPSFSSIVRRSRFNAIETGFTYLPTSSLEFMAQNRSLEAHASFTPLLHMAWRMPVLSRGKALPIHIFAGEDLAKELNPNVAPGLNRGNERWELDGNLKIYLDRYLFIEPKFVINKIVKKSKVPKTEAELLALRLESERLDQGEILNKNLDNSGNNSKQVIAKIIFDQNRRLRSEEIHFLDHPLIGMIIQIRKIKKETVQVTPQIAAKETFVSRDKNIEEVKANTLVLAKPVVSQDPLDISIENDLKNSEMSKKKESILEDEFAIDDLTIDQIITTEP